MADVITRRNDAAHRYEGTRDGEDVGLLDFVREDARIVFTHAETYPRFEGQGVGSAIVRFALDDVRAEGGVTVVPRCPFVRDWIERHPDYQDILDSPTQG